MAEFVIKKDGSKEEFDPEKIKNSIKGAAEGAGISEERKQEVVNRVSSTVMQMIGDRENIETKEIADKVLEELDNIEPSVSKAWREYKE